MEGSLSDRAVALPWNFSPREREALFPIVGEKIFMAHAGVTSLPRVVVDAMEGYLERASHQPQEFDEVFSDIESTRRLAAEIIGARAQEVALLGPTSLGLSLFANGIDWREGDEVVVYREDYPANVYPWMNLQKRGVKVVYLDPPQLGAITPEVVECALTPRTRLVALASCHFFTGYRIDIAAIGQLLKEREILFSLDAIQTVGAFPTTVEYVDFLSADAHKWMLGPMAIGIVYVDRDRFETLEPTLLGAWNIDSPHFVTQDEIRYHPSARRYEPGVLNLAGIYGLKAALEMMAEIGIDVIAQRLLELKGYLVAALQSFDCKILPPLFGANACAITTFSHPRLSMEEAFEVLTEKNVVASLRHDREGRAYLRFSPHFYNTEEEVDRVCGYLRGMLR